MEKGARSNSANTANINKLNLTPDFSEYNLKVEACRCRIKFVPVQSKWKNLRHNSGFYLIATSPTDPCKPHETFFLPFFFLFHNLSSWAHAKSVNFFLEFSWLTKKWCIYHYIQYSCKDCFGLSLSLPFCWMPKILVFIFSYNCLV